MNRFLMLLAAFPTVCQIEGGETVGLDSTHVLEEVEVVSFHNGGLLDKVTAPVGTIMNQLQVERRKVVSIKELSSLVPNYYMPDYGSRMTSAIYIRGLGTRTDNSVMGLYVDGIPYFNKNSFDFDFCDIRSVTVLRGPQGTLFGRNTMGGVIDINTLSPLFFQGTRFRLEYGNANSMAVNGSLYRVLKDSLGVSLSGYFRHSDGFYENEYDGTHCDPSNSAGLRFRTQKYVSSGFSYDNTLSLEWLEQGGYPYAMIEEGERYPVNYNDESSYRRFSITEGFSAKRSLARHTITNVLSCNFFNDCMKMDQDFQPHSFFTLEQRQREFLLSDEALLKPRVKNRKWDWVSGLMLFGKINKMEAPVTFKKEGIDELILHNANYGIGKVFPGDRILFEERQFVISDKFRTGTAGAAIYHNSKYTTDYGLKLEAGLRLDVESSWFRYECGSLIHYMFTYNMDRYKPLNTLLSGSASQLNVEFLPALSVSYGKKWWNCYVKTAKGYKAGGYNTQLFSDLLKNAMQNSLMDDMGIHFVDGETGYSVSDVVEYRPEYSWNYELGFNCSHKAFTLQASAFFISCSERQLTVFPKGENTGRMMTNAGRSRSAGVETSLMFRTGNASIYANWGYTYTDFRKYVSGGTDYRGKIVPYVPAHTIAAGGDYTLHCNHTRMVDYVVFNLLWRGVGPIWWDEDNLFSQRFYGVADCSVSLSRKSLTLEFWSKNVTGTEYDVFSFVSMGNRFVQKGKTRQFGLSVKYDF